MFIHLKDFKRLLKEAYTGVGLCVARRWDDVLFGGSGWVIATEKESMDKKQLAAVIELTGELPGNGEAFKATKKLLRQRRKRTSTKSARFAGV